MTKRTVGTNTLIDGEKIDNLPADTNTELANINAALNTKVDKTTTVNGKALNSNITLNKSDIGLGNVDNTSDVNKPVSTATQNALDLKRNISDSYSQTETNTLLDGKVDKVSGKGLSTEDYTTTEKNKLAGIEANANNYVLPSDVVQDATYVKTDNNFTNTLKSKLDGIEAGAEVNTLNDVIAGTNITIDKTDPLNPVINSTAIGGATDFTDLGDVPASYTGQAGKFTKVNATEDGLEFSTIPGGGDLLSTNNLSDVANITTARENLGLEIGVDVAPALGADDNYVTNAEKTAIGTIGSKANDNEVVKLTGNQTIAGEKTFSDKSAFKTTTKPGEVATFGEGITTAMSMSGASQFGRIYKSRVGSGFANWIVNHLHSTTDHIREIFARAKSDTNSHSPVENGDLIREEVYAGRGATDYYPCASIEIGIDDTGDISNSSMPGKIVRKITPNGSNTPVAFETVSNNGNIVYAGNISAINLSNTNTGDNATNTQYSGLATSKEDVSNKSTTLDTDKTSDTKYPSVKSVYDWAVSLFATITGTQTLTNKRVPRRVVVTTQSATPTINTDNGDIFQITGLAQDITSMTTNLSGTPVAGEMMMIQITDNGTSRNITWGASFASTANATLPTATVISTMLRVLFQRNNANTGWDCVGLT